MNVEWKTKIAQVTDQATRWLATHRKQIKKVAIIIPPALFGLFGIWLIYTYFFYSSLLDSQLAGDLLRVPSGIYAAPRHIGEGRNIEQADFVELLRRAGYQEGEQKNEFAAGNFIIRSKGVEVLTNEFNRNRDLPARSLVTFRNKQIADIENLDTNQKLKEILLPPELLTADLNTKTQVRSATNFEDLPEVLVNALCAIEDRNFFSHSGVDFKAIARAFYKNLSEGGIREGASTITQQLIKNQFLSPERTYRRKFAEAMMAIALEQRLTKQQIFALYCDRAFLGHTGLISIYGFKQAAQVFFGKELEDLSISEAALLAGLTKAPNRYSPYSDRNKAIERRDVVIAAMLEAGYISESEASSAKNEQITFLAPQKLDNTAAPHFVDYVGRELNNRKIDDDEQTSQLRIGTSLDLDLQEAANEVVKNHLDKLSKLYKKRASQPEAALVALDPKTGQILAMVGGRDYAASQLNRVTDAKRQPGSVFKPVVYAAAMSQGVSPMTTFINEPTEIKFGYNSVYRPRNFGDTYSNQPVTLREAMVRSLNVVSVEAAVRVGIGNVMEMAEKMGLKQSHSYPSMALGTSEASPLEIARAYTAFANDGMLVEPIAVEKINANGKSIFTGYSRRESVMPAQTAFIVTDTLSDVVNRGTAARVRQLGYQGPAAGKTGTSSDAWFAGYTPNLLVVVWVGFDDNQDLNMTGGEASVPIWTEFIKRAMQLRPDLAAERFNRPAGLDRIEIDPETGMIANEYCPNRQQVILPRHLTAGICYLHQMPIETPIDVTITSFDADVESDLEDINKMAVEEMTKNIDSNLLVSDKTRTPDDGWPPKQKPR
jgi:penicillin-binding protein 1B